MSLIADGTGLLGRPRGLSPKAKAASPPPPRPVRERILGMFKGERPKRTHNRDITPRLPRDVRRGLLERLVLAGVRSLAPDAQRRLAEGIAGGTLLGRWGTSDDIDFVGYRPLSTRIDRLTRDLDMQTYDSLIRQALWVYATNPLGGWIVDNTVDLTVGQVLTFSAKFNRAHPDVVKMGDNKVEVLEREIGEHLSTFWKHPAHSIETRAAEYATTWLVTGTLLLPATVNPSDGIPMLDLIDAQQIAHVASADKSAIVPGRVFYRPADAGGELKALAVIREQLDGGGLAGEAFYFPLRKLLNTLLGVSYLMPAIDWLDRHDQFYFAALDRARMANSHAWHIALDGLSQQDCDARAAQYEREGTFSSPASIVVTNEKGKIDAVAPNLNAGDTEVLGRTFRMHILGAYNKPESWYGSGSETNRATAGDQSDIAMKTLESCQTKFKTKVFEPLLHFAYDAGRRVQGELRRAWPERKTGLIDISVNMPAIDREFAAVGAALAQVETAIEAAVEGELLSRKTGRSIFIRVASKLGQPIDPKAEEDSINDEAAERKEKAEEEQNRLAAEQLRATLKRQPAAVASPSSRPARPATEAIKGELLTSEDEAMKAERMTMASKIVEAVAVGKLPRDAGLGQLTTLVGLTAAEAEIAMGSVGDGFTPPAPPTAPEASMPALTLSPQIVVKAADPAPAPNVTITTLGSEVAEQIAASAAVLATAAQRVAGAAAGIAEQTGDLAEATGAATAAAAKLADQPQQTIVNVAPSPAPNVVVENKVQVDVPEPKPLSIRKKGDIYEVEPKG